MHYQAQEVIFNATWPGGAKTLPQAYRSGGGKAKKDDADVDENSLNEEQKVYLQIVERRNRCPTTCHVVTLSVCSSVDRNAFVFRVVL